MYVPDADTDVIFDSKRFEDLTREERQAMSKETKLFGIFRACIRDWVENDRNMLVMSLIDHMDDVEYRSIKKQVDEDEQSKKG